MSVVPSPGVKVQFKGPKGAQEAHQTSRSQAASKRMGPLAGSTWSTRTDATTRVFACCPLDEVVLAIESKYVESIHDVGAERQQSANTLDMAARYGIPWHKSERRRCLVVRQDERTTQLLVGSEVSVREFTDKVLPLPAFLTGLARGAFVEGYLSWKRRGFAQRYVFVLDLAALLADARAGTRAPEGQEPPPEPDRE